MVGLTMFLEQKGIILNIQLLMVKNMIPFGPIEGYPFSYSCFMPTNIINQSNSSTKIYHQFLIF